MAGIQTFSNYEILSLIETWRDLNIEGLLDKKVKLSKVLDLVMKEQKKKGFSRNKEHIHQKIKSLKGEFEIVSIILY